MAGKGEAVTTRFEIDIDDLKAGIQEANRQIRLANSVFKAASSGMDDWGHSADGLSAKIQQLTSVQDAETQKLEYLRTQYKLVSEEQGESSSAAQNLLIKLNNQQATVNRVTNELNSYGKKLDDLNAAVKESADAAQQQKSMNIIMKYVFPISLLVLARSYPAGLAIYWAGGQILQIFFNIRMSKYRRKMMEEQQLAQKKRKAEKQLAKMKKARLAKVKG